jgi:hypothetical protein
MSLYACLLEAGSGLKESKESAGNGGTDDPALLLF